MSDVITVIGNLTSPPERRDLSGGGIVARFGLASTERRFENGAWIDVHTSFYNVSVFRRLGEHALASLQRGQRVIVTGRLRMRQWEASGRSGTSADLEATGIGPDLLFGVATFVKDAPAGSTHETSRAPAEAWAAPGTTPDTLYGADGHGGDGAAPFERSTQALIDGSGERPQLVAVGSAPDDATPF